jgi:hypothetical protein
MPSARIPPQPVFTTAQKRFPMRASTVGAGDVAQDAAHNIRL